VPGPQGAQFTSPAPGTGPSAYPPTGYPQPSQQAQGYAPPAAAPAPASKAPWIILGLGTVLALLGTVALVLAIVLRG
jgi:hypothetical protein